MTSSEPRPSRDSSHDSHASAHVLNGTASATAAADLDRRNAAQGFIDPFNPSSGSRFDNPSLSPSSFPSNVVHFSSKTIAPSPVDSPSPCEGVTSQAAHPILEDREEFSGSSSSGSVGSAGRTNKLQIQTDIFPITPIRTEGHRSHSTLSPTGRPDLHRKHSATSLKPVSRTPSVKTALANTLGPASAASSTVSSPVISAMGDVTPLPSPLLLNDSPGPWTRRLLARPPSRESPIQHSMQPDSVLVTSNGESIAAALAHQTKRKQYAGLVPAPGEGGGDGASDTVSPLQHHGRNRSISEFKMDRMALPKRMVTVSGSHARAEGESLPHMRREPHLSEARGLTPVEKPPSPPPSESSASAGESISLKKRRYEYFEARGRYDGKLRRWRAIKLLGQGTFSRVMLATSQISTSEEEEYDQPEGGNPDSGLLTPEPQVHYDRRTLVAVKVCEHGPKGGASEDRIEMSLKRELEIMKSIKHPSLVHLKAWNIEMTRAILVLSYCPGGDLFDIATAHREVLSASLLRRIFCELVGAVQYLHERRIVHRDIKLENVLVNLPPLELSDRSTDWQTYPHSVITLTDLGLSRRIADDEKLETRCGSDDYAAPEVIMGQPYDGRATDAWSLGVLLYALLESRLPFDPHPGMSDAHRMRSRTSHRIARVEWRWIEYAGDDGDHEGDERKFAERGLLGAMRITEGLLKRARSRWPLEKVAAEEWVKGGVQLEGGIKFREEEEGEEVS
ncbi:Serine/threonine-protein kinase PRR1 [Pleurostoma richardsiae]|uniref:Serine/threonine-protein kinase PRR1 n=1 Tax=Pleurostoma richardsiae TaxID=41990 RepID=A0AA38RDZ9_9PEZI|nr:Serine/threonine-protein kinase PRR1 [Pleurostoma richardsiae]